MTEEEMAPVGDGPKVADQEVIVSEGQAKIYFRNEAEVFYNPVQEFNRDLSISVIQLYLNKLKANPPAKPPAKITVLEALSASGLRSIRYAKEIEGIDQIVANDISQKAVETIKRNVKENEVEAIVTPSHNDASMVMYSHRRISERYVVIDLDPYGSPTPFLDAAVQSIADGGLLCITCTDMAVLCGNAPETCYTKYGGISLKSKSCHELALRLVLQCVEAHANRYGRYVKPLLSLSIDFYCRVFVTVETSQAKCKRTTSKLGHLYQCNGCEAMAIQPLGKLETHPNGNIKYKLSSGPPVDQRCEFCGNTHHLGGPIWIAPIHDEVFVKDLIEQIQGEEQKYGTYNRMLGMLSVVSEELFDVPLYYAQDRLCSLVRTGSGKLTEFRSALLNAGYRVSLSHANKLALKTDAPMTFIWDMMRAWEKLNPINRSKISPDSVAHKILNSESKVEVSFELHADANPASRQSSLKRFQVNPERNWGPKTRANTGRFTDDPKRIQNQGKTKKRKQNNEENSDVMNKKQEIETEAPVKMDT